MPLAGIISCCLAFASLSLVVGWVWECALWGDYSRRGIEGLWGIWQLSSDINSSPTPSSLLFFVVAYLFIWSWFWWVADTCPASLIVFVVQSGVVGAEGALQTSRWGNSGCRVCDSATGTLVCGDITPLSGCFGGAGGQPRAASAQHCSSVGPGLYLLAGVLGWRGRTPTNPSTEFTLRYQSREIWLWSMYIALTSTPAEMK